MENFRESVSRICANLCEYVANHAISASPSVLGHVTRERDGRDQQGGVTQTAVRGGWCVVSLLLLLRAGGRCVLNPVNKAADSSLHIGIWICCNLHARFTDGNR